MTENPGWRQMAAKYPQIVVRIAGETNPYTVVTRVLRALRKAGLPVAEQVAFFYTAATTNLGALEQTCGEWVRIRA
jgi:hypothetical protein